MPRTASITPDGVSGVVTEDPEGHPYFPPDGEFTGGDDFLAAPVLETIGGSLIATCEELSILQAANITFRWKRRGGKSGGRAVWGRCTKAAGLVKHFSGSEFVIWVAADHARENRLTNRQLEALLFHELKHIELKVNEDPTSPHYGEETLGMRAEDAAVFYDELVRYGAWEPGLDRVFNAWRQLPIGAGENGGSHS